MDNNFIYFGYLPTFSFKFRVTLIDHYSVYTCVHFRFTPQSALCAAIHEIQGKFT